MKDWKETARELVRRGIVMHVPLSRIKWVHDPGFVQEIVDQMYVDDDGYLIRKYSAHIPDLTDDATAGVLLGMLAKARGKGVFEAMNELIQAWHEPWGHAVALALLEVSE